MFKVLGWLLIMLSVPLFLSVLFIPFGFYCLVFGGVFFCIHKYLNRDDTAVYYEPPPQRRVQRGADDSRAPGGEISNSMFGR